MNNVPGYILVAILVISNVVLVSVLFARRIKSINDRRKYLRMPVDIVPRRFYVQGGSDALLENKVIIKNLSAIGFAVETDYPLMKKKKVFVSYKLPESDKYIECTGRIIWVGRDFHEGLAGIKYTNIHRHDKAFINEYIESRAKKK